MKNPLLQVKDLKVYFKNGANSVKAVDGISFDVGENEVVGVVGESGSGKSVTAKSIMRLLGSDNLITCSGTIHWTRKESTSDILSLPASEVMKIRGMEIGMIFQDPMSSFNPVLTCGEQVAESVRLHLPEVEKVRSEVLDWFEMVDLPDVERIYASYPHQLSGGQLQRVAIAMAMITRPKLIIADEPTTALDVTNQKNIIELIKKVRQTTRASVLFISHDLGVVKSLAHHIVVMYKGKIVEQGDVNEVLEQPTHSYTKALLACRPPSDTFVERLPILEDFKIGASVNEATEKELIWLPKEIPAALIKARIAELVTQNPLIQANNVSVVFSKPKQNWFERRKYLTAVDNVNFSVFPGETLGIVGESGSGKTTLGKSIVGLASIQTGDIQYQGKSLKTLSNRAWRSVRKELQIVFQNPFASLNPSMSIGEAILEPIQFHQLEGSTQKQYERVIYLLEKVGLDESHFERFPMEFSGGQRQRIAIARALAVDPQCIILDEAVSSLDVSVQAQVLNLLKDLQQEFNLTYLFITHDLSVVRFIADRILVMKEGEIVEQGTTIDIFNDPKHWYTRQLLDAVSL